jgi:hypothetical protein
MILVMKLRTDVRWKIHATVSSEYFCISGKTFKFQTDESIILLVLCGCETWFLTLRVEHGLGVFQNSNDESILT